MHIVRRAIAIAAITVVVVSAMPSSWAATTEFKNCAELNAAYPTGIARDTASALRAVARGYQRPTVRRPAFLAAVAANKRLGTPADGVLCEVPIPVTPPSEPQNVTVSNSTTTTITITWLAPSLDGNSPVTGYVVSEGSRTFATTATTYTVSGLAAGTAYTVAVLAVNAAGQGKPTQISASTQAPVPTPTPTPTTPSAGATRYANCTAARAAGVTPIRAPSAIYDANRHLDRDGDGVACE